MCGVGAGGILRRHCTVPQYEYHISFFICKNNMHYPQSQHYWPFQLIDKTVVYLFNQTVTGWFSPILTMQYLVIVLIANTKILCIYIHLRYIYMQELVKYWPL